MTEKEVYNRNLYSYCKANFAPIGVSRPTDAETILELYKKIEQLQNELKEAKKLSVGDKFELNVKGNVINFTLTAMELEQTPLESNPRLIIKGNVL